MIIVVIINEPCQRDKVLVFSLLLILEYRVQIKETDIIILLGQGIHILWL